MTRKPTRSPLPAALIAVAAVAMTAMLVLAGTASAHHHHGREDHHHHRHHHRFFEGSGGTAGTIASFDQGTGRLTIDLAAGDTVSGLVSDETWVDCGHSCDHHGWSDHRLLHGWDHGGWGDDDASSCSADDLVPGATVEEAVLVVSDGQAKFVKIELGNEAPPTAS